jgi:hypothetical protein
MTEKNEKSGQEPQENEASEIGSLSKDYQKEYTPEQKKAEANSEQQPVETVDPDRFPGYKLDKDGEVRKLEVGEYVSGLLISKDHSQKYDAGIYKLKSKDTDVPIVILGSTVLDKKMRLHETGQEIIIVRAANTVNQKGQIVHNWNIYSKEN